MKTLLVRFTLAAVAAIVVMSMAVSAAIATGTVKGSVTQSGNAVAGAKVVINSEIDSSYQAATQTDAQGAFSFSNAPVGLVSLMVFDAADELLASGEAELTYQGQVISVTLEITR